MMPAMTTSIDRCNDGGTRSPRLHRDINLGTMAELPRGSTGWRATPAEQLALLKAEGHEAVQIWQPTPAAAQSARDAGLAVTGICRALTPADVDALVRERRDCFNAELLPQRMGHGAGAFWLHDAQPRSDLVHDPLGGEPSDRHADATRLWDLACDCLAAARQRLDGDRLS